ncbi:MAG: hypothetical protein IJS14_05365 [Lentisphaeria bacterium]|nr:hypothetical protein [Lentisphaeria bacterium]
MAWFAYISKECEKAARLHGVFPKVVELQQKVEELQQDCLPRFHQFPPPYLVKKKFAGKEGRLIAERREIPDGADEHTVIVFLDFMTRGNADYEREYGFGHDPIAYGEQHYRGIAPESELKEYIEKKRPEIHEPSEPSSSEYGYLHAALSSSYEALGDGYIYESNEWNNAINQADFVPRQSEIFGKLSDFTAKNQVGSHVIRISSEIEALGYSFPKDKIHFLAGLGREKEIGRIREKYDKIFAAETSVDTLARYSCRAYPAMVLAADLDLWTAIEGKGSGNMALSPEESQLLTRIESSQDTAYPLFINGRAGSGKSTILQYLFSHYIEYYLKNRNTTEAENNQLPPLYLSWSNTLLDTARKNVKNFLKCSTRNLGEEGQSITDRDIDETFSRAFRPFQSFMLELVPCEERATYFTPDRHISYSRFVELWKEKFGNETSITKLGPEICWHIIRTFIKGTNFEDFLDPDDYFEGLRKEQTVSRDTYELVYKRVWENWYKGLTVGANEETPGDYWDDQDLIRYVIRNRYVNQEYPVVFCDEAQDFTRIELNAILNLSLFSHRKIFSHQVPQLPFAFAGDPFQTLNPTGFRWEAIKNSFVEQFINSHHRSADGRVTELNYCELENNYRSDSAIVKFSNHVQLLRQKVLGQTITPQKPWWEGNQGVVAFFYENDLSFWDWIKDHPEVVFVIPCDKDAEEEFWRNSGMESYRSFKDVTVMSTIAIKGLEYSTIVVCGFGELSPEKLKKYLSEVLREDMDGASENKLSIEYFINKLYVAVSRAQNRLFILDSDEGKKKLWDVFMQRKNSILLQNGGNAELYLTLETGTTRTFSAEQTETDPEKEAKKFFEDGINQCNPYLMSRAASLYEDAKNIREAQRCKAWAFFFEKKYDKAADTDSDANYSLKHRCWWLKGTKDSLEKILNTKDKNSEFLVSEEFHLLENHFNADKPREILTGLDDIYFVYTNKQGKLIDLENATPAWKQLVEILFSKILISGDLTDEEKNHVWESLGNFRKYRLVDNALAGRLAFEYGHFTEAAEWLRDEKDPELISIKKNAEQQAKPLDAQIQSAFSNRNWQAVSDLYHKNINNDFSDHTMQQIAVAAAVQGDASVAEKLFRTRYTPNLLQVLTKEKSIPNEIVKKMECYNLRAMVANCDYETIVRFLKAKQSWEQTIFFVKVFARCDANRFQKDAPHELLIKSTEIIKKVLTKYKNSHILPQHFFETGCALEKSNNIIAAKDFYLIEGKMLTESEQQRALSRALVCHERHAAVLVKEKDKLGQLKRANELREKLNLQGVKLGDPRLPEYELGTDPWGSFENHQTPATPPQISGNESSVADSSVPVATVVASPEPEKASSQKPAGQVQPDSAPLKQIPPVVGNAETQTVPSDSGSVMAEDISKLTTQCEELLGRLKAQESTFFPLSDEKIDFWCKKTQQLAEFCRQILRGDGTEEWHRMVIEADSFATLRELQERRSAERQERQRREEFLHFLNELPAVICKLELKQLPNQRRMRMAQEDLAEVKQNVKNLKIEFPEDRPLPIEWSGERDATEWVRSNLLVEPKSLKEDTIKAILPFEQNICEQLLAWHDCLTLP